MKTTINLLNSLKNKVTELELGGGATPAQLQELWNLVQDALEELPDRSLMDCLPTVRDYRALLDEVCEKEGIRINEARNKYGRYTYAEWDKLLNSRHEKISNQ